MGAVSGIQLIEETEGTGEPARKGDHVVFNMRIFLNKGDEVPINEEQANRGLPVEIIRHEGDRIFIDHRMELGKRRAIAGIEHSLVGMKPGGYRKVRVSAHLAYRDEGIPGLIPANAVLVIQIWLREVRADTTRR